VVVSSGRMATQARRLRGDEVAKWYDSRRVASTVVRDCGMDLARFGIALLHLQLSPTSTCWTPFSYCIYCGRRYGLLHTCMAFGGKQSSISLYQQTTQVVFCNFLGPRRIESKDWHLFLNSRSLPYVDMRRKYWSSLWMSREYLDRCVSSVTRVTFV
jgi:hypothetical protein